MTVPGAPAGWAALHERYATRPMAELFAPCHRADAGLRAFSNAPILNHFTRSLTASPC